MSFLCAVCGSDLGDWGPSHPRNHTRSELSSLIARVDRLADAWALVGLMVLRCSRNEKAA